MIKLTPFKQTDSSRCGPASIKMILDYYGIDASEDEICEKCGHSFELGCTDFQMKSALESYGLNVEIKNNAKLSDLELYEYLRIPVIVDWFSPGYQKPDPDGMPNGHSSVLIGVDNEYVHLMDPEMGGPRKIEKNEFMRVWFDWRHDPYLQSWNDMILRQMIIPRKRNGF